MSVTRRIKDAQAEFKPVIAKNNDWPQGCEENKQFWDATPAGDAELRFVSHAVVDVEPGQYFYIDMEEVPEDVATWKLWKVARTETQMEVCLSLGWDTHRDRLAAASLNMTIGNQEAWRHFEGKQGTSWRVVFLPADGDHPNCPYTGQ